MQSRGYSLVEVVVVTGIVSVLLAIATLKFKEFAESSRIEAQTRLIYSELLKARINALYQRRTTRVKLYPDRFEVYSSTRDDSDGAAAVQTRALQYPITCNGNGDAENGYALDFDAKGLARNACSICLAEERGLGGVDSVIIAPVRLSVGKKEQGDACKAEHITIR